MGDVTYPNTNGASKVRFYPISYVREALAN